MKIDSIEKFVALGKENAEALVKSGSVAAKGLEDVAKASQDYIAVSSEKADAAFKAFFACKSPAEMLELNAKLARESVEGVIADSRKFVELTQSVVTAALEPISARVAAFQSLVKSAA